MQLLQAVVLSDADRLDVEDLQLPELLGARPSLVPSRLRTFITPGPGEPVEGRAGFEDAWLQLRAALEGEVQRAASGVPRLSLPLGRWLAHEVVLVAHDQMGGVGARAAARIGLPQTTFARRLRQAETDRSLTARPATWIAVKAALTAVVSAPDQPSEALADRAETLLLDVVLAHAPAPIAYAAALMGLSPPTMKQRLASRAAS